MSEYIIAHGKSAPFSTYKFTDGKIYKVLEWFHKSAKVRDDNGALCFVSVGGPTTRLVGGGRFQLMSGYQATYNLSLGVKQAEPFQVTYGDNDGKGWMINKDGAFAISSNNFIPSKVMYDHNGKQVDVKKACETLDALTKVLGVSDWSELELQAKIKVALADALVKLENGTKC